MTSYEVLISVWGSDVCSSNLLFAYPSLYGASRRAVRPSPDGRLVAYLKSRDDDAQRRDLWLVGRDGRNARMLVDTATLGSGAALSEAEKMRRERARPGGSSGMVAYRWAAAGRERRGGVGGKSG